METFLQSGVLLWVIWIVFAAMLVYAAVAIWSHLSLGRLFWQNISGSNRVALPKIARTVFVPETTNSDAESQVLVLARPENETADPQMLGEARVKSGPPGVIYPVAGRNGLHFRPNAVLRASYAVMSVLWVRLLLRKASQAISVCSI